MLENERNSGKEIDGCKSNTITTPRDYAATRSCLDGKANVSFDDATAVTDTTGIGRDYDGNDGCSIGDAVTRGYYSSDICPAEVRKVVMENVIFFAACAERGSEHPLAKGAYMYSLFKSLVLHGFA